MTARVFGFAGWSGSGKTTLIEQLIARLTAGGARVSLIKHAHHAFDVDQPGKDSHRHRVAGASEVLISSANRFAVMHELRGEPELSWQQAVSKLWPCDLVLIEGYKRAAIPKLEIWRAEIAKPLLFPTDAHIIGLATDDPLPSAVAEPNLARYGLADIDAIAAFALKHAATVAG
ncbi:MAG: molybdopterin-guanine dinucleotide biosynthesis protein B [Betaproteobacteria bacterium]|nr:MAG: molybdopterin-guanine dinucleotide biosynthesis protein B [Betaproteobacteria bacterium]